MRIVPKTGPGIASLEHHRVGWRPDIEHRILFGTVFAYGRQQVRDRWGAPRGADRLHEGIDIFASRGTPILSATNGIVTGTGQSNLGGNVVWIIGPRGSRHYYAHLESFGQTRPGQRVRPGDVIGFVGDSGNARGGAPHLHYGIYTFGGGATNPYPYLAGTEASNYQ